MGIGAARLSSMVCEHDDLPHFQGDELSAELFHSPAVQFFMLNKDTLMSLVELPTLEPPRGSAMSDLRTAHSQVNLQLDLFDIIHLLILGLGANHFEEPRW